MKKSRFTEHQILSILKEQEAGAKVSDICTPKVFFELLLGHRMKSFVRSVINSL